MSDYAKRRLRVVWNVAKMTVRGEENEFAVFHLEQQGESKYDFAVMGITEEVFHSALREERQKIKEHRIKKLKKYPDYNDEHLDLCSVDCEDFTGKKYYGISFDYTNPRMISAEAMGEIFPCKDGKNYPWGITDRSIAFFRSNNKRNAVMDYLLKK